MVDFRAALTENTHTKQDEIETTNVKDVTPLDEAKHQLSRFQSSVMAMRAEAEAIEVKDEASEARATAMRGQTKTLLNQITSAQDAIIAEPQTFVKSVQGFTLPFRKALEDIDKKILKPKQESYAWKKEQARRIAEAEAQKAAAAAQKRIDAQAKRAGVESVQLPAPVIPERQAAVRTESGTSSTTFRWTYEVIEAGKVPAKFLVADPTDRARVMQAIDAGERAIPGLRIFEKAVTSTRRA